MARRGDAPVHTTPRLAMVEGVRALGALMILLDHTAAMSAVQPDTLAGSALTRLNAGVAVFFVLSGFLLFRRFVAARLAGTPAPGVRRYLCRQLLRIVPAYYVAAVLGALFLGVGGVLTHEWWAHAALPAGVRLLRRHRARVEPVHGDVLLPRAAALRARRRPATRGATGE